METRNKYFYFVPELQWKLERNPFISYQNYKGNWKQILLFRTRNIIETGNQYFSFVPEMHWKLETNTFLSYQNNNGNWKRIFFFRTRTTLGTEKRYFSFVPELHCNLATTLLSYKDQQRPSLQYKGHIVT